MNNQPDRPKSAGRFVRDADGLRQIDAGTRPASDASAALNKNAGTKLLRKSKPAAADPVPKSEEGA
ncbi:MAG: hypothetical protein ACPGOY_06935 [Rhodospirillaceae bacterium]